MKIKRCNALGAIVAALIITSGFGTAMGAEALKKIVIAYSSIAPHQAPAWVAMDAGIFRRNGLDVQLIYVESGSRTIQTLVSGDVVAAQSAGPAAIQSNLQGSGVVLVAGILNTLDYKFMVARDITRPDQLKGKAIPGAAA